MNIDFVQLYFAICLIAWIISMIACVAIYCIKPLRKRIIKKYWALVFSFSNDFLELFPEDKKEAKDENLQSII